MLLIHRERKILAEYLDRISVSSHVRLFFYLTCLKLTAADQSAEQLKEYTNTHTQSHMCEMNVEEKWKESSSRCEKPEGGDLVGFTRKLSFSSASLVNYIVRNPIRVFTVHWTPPFVSTSSVSVCVLRDSIHNPFKQLFLFGFSPGH